MIEITDRGAPITVVAFSGLAPENHVYEWTKALSAFPVNVIGVKDPENAWYQREFTDFEAELRDLPFLRRDWVAIGGSMGGFGAILFGYLFDAKRVVTFTPQSASGRTKRRYGDLRWPEWCEKTPDFDVAGLELPALDAHVGDDPLDIMHAERLTGANVIRHPGIGHNLPLVLKESGKLRRILEDALELEAA